MTQAQPAPPLGDSELDELEAALDSNDGLADRALRAVAELRRLRSPVEGAGSLGEVDVTLANRLWLSKEKWKQFRAKPIIQDEDVHAVTIYMDAAWVDIDALSAANAALSKTNTSQGTTIVGLEARVKNMEANWQKAMNETDEQVLRAEAAEALLKDPVGAEEVREVHIALDNIPMRSGTPAQADLSRLREDHVKAIEILTRLSAQLTEAKVQNEAAAIEAFKMHCDAMNRADAATKEVGELRAVVEAAKEHKEAFDDLPGRGREHTLRANRRLTAAQFLLHERVAAFHAAHAALPNNLTREGAGGSGSGSGREGMRFHKGKVSYKVPPYSDIHNVVVEVDGVRLILICRDYDSLRLMEEQDPRGERTGHKSPYFYACEGYDRIRVWPAPQKTYRAEFRYTPPVMEF